MGDSFLSLVEEGASFRFCGTKGWQDWFHDGAAAACVNSSPMMGAGSGVSSGSGGGLQGGSLLRNVNLPEQDHALMTERT
jgi:hypothetical protein